MVRYDYMFQDTKLNQRLIRTKELKVCLISSYYPKPSGIGTYTSYLKKELRKHVKSNILAWNFYGFAKMISPLTHINKIRKALNYDIVHVQYHLGDFHPLFLPTLCVLKHKAKIVLTLHEDYTNIPYHPLITFFHNAFYRCADLLIVHTQDQTKVLSKTLKNRTVVIPHGVIYRKTRRKPEKDTMILPGFINRWKGHDLLIRAMPLVLKKVPNAKLLIIGKAHDTTYATELRWLVSELKLRDHVTIKDSYVKEKQLFKHIQSSDIAVLPYRRITMSGILCHIISWNIPSVVSDLPVLKEFTKGKATYFRDNDAQDLANKIVSLLTNHTKKSRMSEEFKKISKQISWQSVALMTADAYTYCYN